MIHIFYSHVTAPLPPAQWHTLLQTLPNEQQARILRYLRWQDQHTSLLSRLLLRYALTQLGEPLAHLAHLSTDSHRRPYFAAATDLDFNLSHSHTCAACAVTRSGRIGIDLEYQRSIEFEHFRNILSQAQWTQLQQQPAPLPLFYRFWTLKEAVTKADGRGLGLAFDHIEETPPGQVVLAQQTWWVQHITLELPEYVCAIASSEAQPFSLHAVPIAAF